MVMTAAPQVGVCLTLTQAISTTRTVDEIYAIALDTLADGLGVSRAAILLFDPDGVMRFKAWRRISNEYRATVEGHTPWQPDTHDPQPLVVPDVTQDPSLAAYLPTIEREGIAAMAFIPLVSVGRVIGKFMLYYDVPHELSPDELQLAGIIAALVAFAVERTRAEEQARRSEERLRFALGAAEMGTWELDLSSQRIRWSDNLERIHGLAPGTFDGSFAAYEKEIHPEDRARVLASVQRAVSEGVPHDVEYRIVAPDGTIQWVEGKGDVEHEHGKPVRLTGVCMVVTRRKAAELARLEAAEEASRLKDNFLATLSHELRTPLNAILGWVQMLQTGNVPPERVRQAFEVIGRNVTLQAQLIEDILDVSRIITGKLEIEHVPVVLSSLIDTVLSGAMPAAHAKHIELTKSVSDDVPAIEGDPKRLHQVLGNVLANAIKFTPDGGRVQIRCSREGSDIMLAVQDSGVGIAAEFLPQIFDRFSQADSRSTRKHGGLGLGLAIARHLLELHGGDIRAHSDGPSQGTTIVMRLPQRGQLVTRSSRPTRDSRLPDVDDVDVRMDGSTVLVVDDQRDSRDLLGALFERCGARVVQCDGVEAALEVLTRSRVHLLVADIAMPDKDGYELIRRIRESHNRLPAVAVSAYARPQDRRSALAAGYDGYCAKPIEAPQFLRTVRDVLLTAS
jgi:PAS domain S-box-containing protein